MIPLSLYIHFPWCVKKCPYCDFNSHVASTIDEPHYIQALLADLETEKPWIQDRTIQSIFMGGGTPSLFSAESMAILIESLDKHLRFSSNIEITLEANPGTFEQQRFVGYRNAGINRLSMGIQSFSDHQLKSLGRIHDSQAAHTAIKVAQHAGFDNFNLDLMHGLPNQSVDEALLDLEIALSYKPPHLSWYQLTLEPNTVFAKYPPNLPNDDKLADIEDAGLALLQTHGYERYEISAYTQNQQYCRHNLNYWQFGDYIGIGAGAHGKYTRDNKIIRRHKKKIPHVYLKEPFDFVAETIEITESQQLFEYMLNKLRLFQPIYFEEIATRIQYDQDILENKLKSLQQKEMILVHQDHFQVTPLGFQFLNDIMVSFLSA